MKVAIKSEYQLSDENNKPIDPNDYDEDDGDFFKLKHKEMVKECQDYLDKKYNSNDSGNAFDSAMSII